MDEYLIKHHGIQDAVIGCVSFWQQNDRRRQNDKVVASSSIMSNVVVSYSESNKTPVDVGQGTDQDSNVLTFLHGKCSVVEVATMKKIRRQHYTQQRTDFCTDSQLTFPSKLLRCDILIR